jgi:hypothetical protein
MSSLWNKSNREHTIIGSELGSVRAAAAIELGWKLPYFCDADHINLSTVERFLDACDFYAIDVAAISANLPTPLPLTASPAVILNSLALSP